MSRCINRMLFHLHSIILSMLIMHQAFSSSKELPNATNVPNVTCIIAIHARTTGSLSDHGIAIENGVDLALSELTEAARARFRIIVQDTQCNGRKSIEAVKEAIKQNVSVIIGDQCSSACLMALPYVNAAKLPMISPSATSPALSIIGDYFWRTAPSDVYQGTYLASFLAKKNHKRVAIIYGVSEAYGEGIAHSLQNALNLMSDAKISMVAALGFLSKDFSSGQPIPWQQGQLLGLIKSAPDVVVLLSNYPDAVISAAVELRQLNYTGAFAGADSIAGLPLLADYPELDGFMGTCLYRGTESFKDKYLQAYLDDGYTVDDVPPVAAQAYDAFKIIQRACLTGNGSAIRRSTGREMQASFNQHFRSKLKGAPTQAYTLWPAATDYVTFDAAGDNTYIQYDILVLKKGFWFPLDVTSVGK